MIDEKEFKRDQLSFVISILLGRVNLERSLDRYEYELLGYDWYQCVEHGFPDAAGVRLACQYYLMQLLSPLLEKTDVPNSDDPGS